jgi:hypothetical protein
MPHYSMSSITRDAQEWNADRVVDRQRMYLSGSVCGSTRFHAWRSLGPRRPGFAPTVGAIRRRAGGVAGSCGQSTTSPGTTTVDAHTVPAHFTLHDQPPVANLSYEQIKRRPILGGLTNEYERQRETC